MTVIYTQRKGAGCRWQPLDAKRTTALPEPTGETNRNHNGGKIMNEKTLRQIEEMKKQFFYRNLQENVKTRLDAYYSNNL